MDELRCIALNGLMHGNGFPPESLDAGLEDDPHFIGVDTGTTDSGPYYLGSGTNMYPSRQAVNEVLRVLLTRARRADVPLLIGSAATAGARPHVEWLRESIRHVAEEEGLSFDLASIYADVEKESLTAHRREGRTAPLDRSRPLTDETIETTDRVVGVMGPEPYIEALDRGADVVLAGRSSDVAIFKAMAVREGLHEGLATHMAKTIECGGQIVKPETGGECVFASLTRDRFCVQPTNPEKYTDPLTIASHLLYETQEPTTFVEPRGVLDTSDSTYEAVDDRTVEVRGSTFEPADQYTVKLEGARELGHRAVTTLGIRDPVLVGEQIEPFLRTVREWVREKAADLGVDPDDYEFHVHVYGKHGVMGKNEPVREPAHELGLFLEVVAPSPDDANALLHLANNRLLHSDFPGRTCTSGNVAFPMSPKEIDAGKAYEFSIHHTLAVDDPLEPFDVRMEHIGGEAA